MAATSINGHIEHMPVTESSKCSCCPYGFHIDLGFVDFVENVANESGNVTASLGDGSDMKNGRNGLQRSSSNHLSDQGSNASGCCAITIQNQCVGTKASFDSLGFFFSDSLENIVSDFEETLNLREQGLQNSLKNTRKNVPRSGYVSDYGTMQRSSNRPLPLRKQAASPLRKPLLAAAVQQHGYHTALGKAMLGIKSKHQNSELNSDSDDFGKNIFATDNAQAQGIRNTESRSCDIGPFQGPGSHRSLYEQGKTHYLGSRTPDMPRRSFTLALSRNHYPNDAQPQWRMRSSMERLSSAVDMDGFVSMRRRKADGNTFRMNPKPIPVAPIPYPRNCSLFSDVVRCDRSPASPLLPNLSTTMKYAKSKNSNDVKPIARASMRNISNEIIENDYAQSMSGDALPARSEDPKDNITVKRLCLHCYDLQTQLSDLSCRLKQATEEMRSKEVGKLKKENGEAVLVDKSIGDSCEIPSNGTTEWIKVDKKDAANDALIISVDDKGTSVSLTDLVEMQNNALVPEPELYSAEKLLISGKDNPEYQEERCPEAMAINGDGCGSDVFTVMCDFSSMTDAVKLVDSGTGGKQSISFLKDSSSMTSPITSHSRHIQTEPVKTRTVCICTSPVHMLSHSVGAVEVEKTQKDSSTICDKLTGDFIDAVTEMDTEILLSNGELLCPKISCSTVALQTEFEPDQSEPRIIDDTEIAESLWLIPPRDRKDVAVGNEDDVIEPHEIAQPSDNIKLRKNSLFDSDDEDTICIAEETLSDPEDIDFGSSRSQLPSKKPFEGNLDVETTGEVVTENKTPRTLGYSRACIVKKMLTEKSQPLSFIRGTATSKSWKPIGKKGDPLQYIVDQHKAQSGSTPSTPQTTKSALKEKVNLKKDTTPQMPLSRVPEPVPARIPRPKISKYIPGETVPQSPDEEAEIADRLTPLRSEMRTLRTYCNGRTVKFSRPIPSLKDTTSRVPFLNYYKTNNLTVFEDSTSSSSDSEGSYNTNEAGAAEHFESTPQLSEAIEILKKHFQKPDSVESSLVDWAANHAKHEWLKTAARKTASAIQVEGFIDLLEATSDAVLKFVINLADSNENTALHYAVSHGNFDVVSVLLDSRLCNLDRANKAGYTAVMLASLCDASDEVEAAVIHRLFQLGNVNAQASQHGQTALMLAVSHGKINTTKLLIDCQADLNIQDEEGSTALMCAAEHGHKEIVKLLLQQHDIDASLSDCDSSTALSIAVENGHRDIGVLIYAHLNHSFKKDKNLEKMESNS